MICVQQDRGVNKRTHSLCLILSTIAQLRMNQQSLALHSYFEERINYATRGKVYNKMFLPYRINCVELAHMNQFRGQLLRKNKLY